MEEEAPSKKLAVAESPDKEVVAQYLTLDNLKAIGRIVADRGEPPKNAPQLAGQMRSLKTSDRPGEGYVADVNLRRYSSTRLPQIMVQRLGPPDRPYAIQKVVVSVSVDNEGRIVILTNKKDVPKAGEFEEPRGSGEVPYISKDEFDDGRVEVQGPIDTLGPKTQAFLDDFTQEALDAFEAMGQPKLLETKA